MNSLLCQFKIWFFEFPSCQFFLFQHYFTIFQSIWDSWLLFVIFGIKHYFSYHPLRSACAILFCLSSTIISLSICLLCTLVFAKDFPPFLSSTHVMVIYVNCFISICRDSGLGFCLTDTKQSVIFQVYTGTQSKCLKIKAIMHQQHRKVGIIHTLSLIQEKEKHK